MTGLRAGAAMVDITPVMGIQIAGDIGRYRPVEEIREPLYARALAVEAGGRTGCLLSLDILAIDNARVEYLRREAQARFGLDPEALLVHVVQNHAAPAIGHFFVRDSYPFSDDLWFLRGGDDRYNPGALEGILAAIGQALQALEPARMAVGRGVDGRVAFNRRFIMRDGTAKTHPPNTDPDILQTEGPIDPEVSIATFTAADGRVIAALLHHTCHPVHGYPERWISGGWPGAWADEMQEIVGVGCVPLVMNGACGNVHHNNHLDPTYRDDYHGMAAKLVETSRTVLGRLEPVDVPEVVIARRMLRIPLRELDAEEMAGYDRLLAEHPEPIWLDEAHTAVHWDWIYAHSMMDLRDVRAGKPYYDYEIQLFRLGSLAIPAWVGEPFVEAQLRLKRHSPARWTMVAHMSNGYVGYIPTVEALARGGYETRAANHSKLAVDALETITDATLEMLEEAYR